MKRILRQIFTFLLFACLAHCGRVTDTVGETGAKFVSDSQEVKLGRQFHEQLRQDTSLRFYTEKPGYNQRLVSYIDTIGHRLARNQETRPDFLFHFFIIDNDSTVNAFALPGGYIYLFTGLIDSARNEAEIAGVMAHEIGHVTERHGVERLMAQKGYDFILDILVGDSTRVRNVVDIAAGLSVLDYSKDQEYEADSLSIDYLIASGYNPLGMKTFLEFLASKQGVVFEPLSTHPDSDKRVAEVDSLISRHDPKVTDYPYYIVDTAIPEI